MNKQREKILNYLNEHNITYELTEHPKVKTVEAINKLKIDPNNEIVKNLFLTDEKRRVYLLFIVPKNKGINLKDLSEKVGLKRLSFASPERLKKILDIEPGSVSPLSVLNDKNNIVKVYFDEEIKSFKKIGVHPNDNTATLWIKPDKLIDLIIKKGNELKFIVI